MNTETMNTETAGETIAANLSLKTYEKLMLQMDGNKNPLTSAKEFITKRFEGLLNWHFNHDESTFFNRFLENSTVSVTIQKHAKSEDEKENLLSELCSLYCDSFMLGYIAAIKDGESFFEDIIVGGESKTKSPASAPTLTGQPLNQPRN